MSEPTRGRPQDPALQQQRKQQLLDAAATLLGQKSYRSITIRDIGEQAGMKSAMVSYYFGSKEGLFLALIEHFAAHKLSQLGTAMASDDPLKAFIHQSLQVLTQSQPIVRLVTDEMLNHEGPLRDRFIELIPGRISVLLPQLLAGYQQRGELRPDLDLKWTAFSLINLLMTPFLIAPVREAAWSISQQDLASDAWAEHIHSLFIHGVQRHDH